MFNRNLALGIIALMLCIGCGEKAAESSAEEAVEALAKANGIEIDMNIGEDGTMTIETPDGEVSYKADAETGSLQIESEQGSMVVGESSKIPADFPEDVPLVDGFKPAVVSAMGTEGDYMVSGTVGEDADAIKAFYSKEATDRGWKETMAMDQQGTTMLTYGKDGRVLQVVASGSGDTTTLSITVTHQ